MKVEECIVFKVLFVIKGDLYWRSYFLFCFWCLMFFTCYEIGRILFIKGYKSFTIWRLKNKSNGNDDDDDENQVQLV